MTPDRTAVGARPALNHACRVYVEAVNSEPKVMGWAGAWLRTHNARALEDCTDEQLYNFAVEVRAATTELREERPVPEFRPDPRTVRELREAEQAARAQAVMQADEEEWARERLRRSLNDGVRAARLTWLAMRGRLEDMPPLEWGEVPTDAVFDGVAR